MNLHRIGFLVVVAFVFVADANATTYYVRKSGSDSNSGTSPAQALKSIKKAALLAHAGDTVHVGAGTYTDQAKVAADGTSSNPIRFVADSSGAQTGDAGDVIVAQNKGFYVEYDHYIEIVGFIFNGQAEMVYFKDSVGGVVRDCEFRNGQTPLSLQNSRVTIDRCTIHDNQDDGILVDGHASIVIVTNCTITNSTKLGISIKDATQIVITDTVASDNGNHGIRLEAPNGIATVARCIMQRNQSDGFHSHGQHQLAIENCLITDNSGDGIQMHADNPTVTVNHCTIASNGDNGIDGSHGSGTVRNSIVALNADKGIRGSGYSKDYNLYYGNMGGNGFSTGGSHDIFGNPKFVGAGNYRLQASSPAIDSGTGAVTEDLNNKQRPSGAGVDRGCYEEGPPTYYVRTSGDDSNSGTSPSEAFRTINRAAAFVAEGAIVYVGGGTYLEGVVVETLGTSSKPILFVADTTGAKTGDAGAVIVTAPVDLQYSWSVQNSEYVVLDGFRLSGVGVAQANGLLVESSSSITIKNCEIDSTVRGIYGISSAMSFENLLIHDTTTCGIWLNDITDADLQVTNLTLTDNEQYGLFIDSCDLNFDATNFADWAISGSSIVIGGVSSNLTFDSVTLSGGTTAGVELSQGTMTATNTTFAGSGYGLSVDGSAVTLTSCNFSGNSVGLYANQNQSLLVNNSTLTSNSAWGVVVHGGGMAGATTFENCNIHGNLGGLSMINTVDGQVLLRSGTVIQNNTSAGLHFDGCDMTIDDQAAEGWLITSNQHGIYAENSTLTIDGLTSSGNTYGVWLTSSEVAITNSTFSGSTYGLWAASNNALSVDSSTFSGNSSYGAYLEGNGSFHNCAITGNGSGLYVNNTNLSDANLTGTDISGNNGYGLYIYNASLSLISQSPEGWSIDSNGYNVAGYQADILLVGVSMTNATSYGLFAQYGSVDLQQSTITSTMQAVGGFYTNGFTVDRSQVSGSSAGTWAIVNYDGGLTLRNSVVLGGQYGVYSYGMSKPVTIYNATIVDASLCGVYAYNGDMTVMNTIIAGASGNYGLYRAASATVTHTYNLVSGFTVPFENTSADATEVLDSPRFVDAANGDYRLGKGSPAINAGADLSASHTIDMLGNPRPSRKVFEIGAYEYIQAGGSLRILSWQEKR